MPLFYRILRGPEPTREDFLPDKDSGKPRQVTPDNAHLLEGFSAYDGEAAARRTARRFPRLGMYLAEMLITVESGILCEQTLNEGPPGRRHYTLKGTPEAALATVQRVLPV